MMRTRYKTSLGLFGALLIAALALQWLPKPAPMPGKGQHLAAALAGDLPGRVAQDVPIGASEAGSGEVENILRFDDVLYRTYTTSSGDQFALYVAYWNPGKMPVQLVATHNPDYCWTVSGWKCTESRYAFAFEDPALRLRPAQEREFQTGAGQTQRVLFWHLIGGELYDYGERLNTVPNPVKWWREVMRSAWRRPQEQYFIRVSSTRPFEQLEADPGFRELVKKLAGMGLKVGTT